MTCKMNILTRIRHIFPYLYYRLYQNMYKTERDRRPDLRAFGIVCVIKTMYVFSFFLLPLNAVLFDNPIVFLFPLILPIILFFSKNTRKKYHKMMPIWKNETESQRRVKFWYLILFCVCPYFSYIPIILILRYFSLIK